MVTNPGFLEFGLMVSVIEFLLANCQDIRSVCVSVLHFIMIVLDIHYSMNGELLSKFLKEDRC